MVEDSLHRAARHRERAALPRGPGYVRSGPATSSLHTTSCVLHLTQILPALLCQRQTGAGVASSDELRRALRRWDKQVSAPQPAHRQSSMDVSRISADGVDLKPEAVDLVEVAREIVTRLWGAVASAETLPTVLAEAGPVVGLWDPLRVEQVVSNLLANASRGRGSCDRDRELQRAFCLLRGSRSVWHRHRVEKTGEKPSIPSARVSRVYGGWAGDSTASDRRRPRWHAGVRFDPGQQRLSSRCGSAGIPPTVSSPPSLLRCVDHDVGHRRRTEPLHRGR